MSWSASNGGAVGVELHQALSLLGALTLGVAGSEEERPDHRLDTGAQLRW